MILIAVDGHAVCDVSPGPWIFGSAQVEREHEGASQTQVVTLILIRSPNATSRSSSIRAVGRLRRRMTSRYDSTILRKHQARPGLESGSGVCQRCRKANSDAALTTTHSGLSFTLDNASDVRPFSTRRVARQSVVTGHVNGLDYGTNGARVCGLFSTSGIVTLICERHSIICLSDADALPSSTQPHSLHSNKRH